MKYFAGIDVGGTNTKIGLLDKEGNILKTVSIKTESEKGPENTIRRIWKEVIEIADALSINVESIAGIGVGIPGPVVNESVVKIAANFSWGNNFPAKKMFEEITGKNVKIGNDVKVIALGEQLYGAGKGYRNSITIPIGTGIAAGIIIEGKILSGSTGAGGEFGHIVINKNGHKCGCGLIGCLETYCSATGIVREAKVFLENNKNNHIVKGSSLFKLAHNNFEKLEAFHIFEEAKKKDKASMEIVDNFCDNLAHGLGTLLNIINPEVIIFAGGVAKAGNIIIDGVNKHLYKYALKMTVDNLKIVFGELEENAGIKGAGALVINNEGL